MEEKPRKKQKRKMKKKYQKRKERKPQKKEVHLRWAHVEVDLCSVNFEKKERRK